MSPGETTVFLSAVIYWAGVVINIYRVRKHIGHSPNIRPKGIKERLLWLGWFIVISGWLVQPFITGRGNDIILFSFIHPFSNRYMFIAGILLLTGGYAGTLWCYSALGDSWRIGVNRDEKTALVGNGPYRTIRHPIYMFQIIMLAGCAAILPTLFSLLIIMVHFVCVLIKSLDEEAYLLGTHDEEYRKYYSRTGRFLPKL